MSNQPPPPRPWFRLPSMARPAAPVPTPTPEPPPPQPRPALARPAFRPVALPQPAPTQPQQPTAAPPPPAATVPLPVAAPPPETLPPAAGVASVPTSPVPTSTVLPVTTSSVPTSPAPKPAASASIPTSPATKLVTTTSSVPASPAAKAVTTTATRVPSPGPSLRSIRPAVQTPPQSPKPKPTAPPPSPLTLPPSRVKSDADLEPRIPLVAQQKTVLVQKTIDKPKVARDSLRDFADSLSSGIARLAKQDTAEDVQKKEKGDRKKISSDSEDVGTRVITIAGENKGAFMEVIHSPKKHVFEGKSYILHKTGNPRGEGSEWRSYSSSDEEGNSKKDKNHKGRAMGPSPMSAFMNSNVQGVNNSICYNSSCSHHDPGVHVALSRKPAGAAGFHVKDRGNGYQS